MLEPFCCLLVLHDMLDPGTDGLSSLKIASVQRGDMFRNVFGRYYLCFSDHSIVGRYFRPAVGNHIGLALRIPNVLRIKVIDPRALPALATLNLALPHLGICLMLVAHVNRRWCPLEDIELLCPLCEVRNRLNGRRTRTYDPNSLVL